MAAQVPSGPQNGVAYTFYIALRSQADSTAFKANPTLAAGDVKVSIDGGALANLATLPTNTPASSVMVKVALSSGEMTGDNITVVFIDAAGAEWFNEVINIQTGQYRSIVVDANGLADATTVKLGPTGAATAQVARDLGTSVLLSSGTGTGQVKLASGYIAPNWGDVGNPTTTLNLSGTTISAVSGAVGSVTGAVASVTARVTANTDQLAGQTVTAAAGVTFPASVASPTNITAGTITTATNVTNAPTAGDFTATMKTSIGTAVAASAVASVTAAVTVGTMNAAVIDAASLATAAKAAIADAFLDRNMATGTDSGSATVRTPRQALRVLRNKVDTVSSPGVVTKEDDSTTSWEFSVTTSGSAAPITIVDPANS